MRLPITIRVQGKCGWHQQLQLYRVRSTGETQTEISTSRELREWISLCCVLLKSAIGQLYPIVNVLRPTQNDRHFPDDIFKRIFLNETCFIWWQFHWNLSPSFPFVNSSVTVKFDQKCWSNALNHADIWHVIPRLHGWHLLNINVISYR